MEELNKLSSLLTNYIETVCKIKSLTKKNKRTQVIFLTKNKRENKIGSFPRTEVIEYTIPVTKKLNMSSNQKQKSRSFSRSFFPRSAF